MTTTRWSQCVYGKFTAPGSSSIVPSRDYEITGRSLSFPPPLLSLCVPSRHGLSTAGAQVSPSPDYPWIDDIGGIRCEPIVTDTGIFLLLGRIAYRSENLPGGRRYFEGHYLVTRLNDWELPDPESILRLLTTTPLQLESNPSERRLPELELPTWSDDTVLPQGWLTRASPLLEFVLSGSAISLQDRTLSLPNSLQTIWTCLLVVPLTLAWRLPVGACLFQSDPSLAICHAFQTFGPKILAGKPPEGEGAKLENGQTYVRWLERVSAEARTVGDLRRRLAEAMPEYASLESISPSATWREAASAVSQLAAELSRLHILRRRLDGTASPTEPILPDGFLGRRNDVLATFLDHPHGPAASELATMLDSSWNAAWSHVLSASASTSRRAALATLLGVRFPASPDSLLGAKDCMLSLELARVAQGRLAAFAVREPDCCALARLVEPAEKDAPWLREWRSRSTRELLAAYIVDPHRLHREMIAAALQGTGLIDHLEQACRGEPLGGPVVEEICASLRFLNASDANRILDAMPRGMTYCAVVETLGDACAAAEKPRRLLLSAALLSWPQLEDCAADIASKVAVGCLPHADRSAVRVLAAALLKRALRSPPTDFLVARLDGLSIAALGLLPQPNEDSRDTDCIDDLVRVAIRGDRDILLRIMVFISERSPRPSLRLRAVKMIESWSRQSPVPVAGSFMERLALALSGTLSQRLLKGDESKGELGRLRGILAWHNDEDVAALASALTSGEEWEILAGALADRAVPTLTARQLADALTAVTAGGEEASSWLAAADLAPFAGAIGWRLLRCVDPGAVNAPPRGGGLAPPELDALARCPVDAVVLLAEAGIVLPSDAIVRMTKALPDLCESLTDRHLMRCLQLCGQSIDAVQATEVARNIARRLRGSTARSEVLRHLDATPAADDGILTRAKQLLRPKRKEEESYLLAALTVVASRLARQYLFALVSKELREDDP